MPRVLPLPLILLLPMAACTVDNNHGVALLFALEASPATNPLDALGTPCTFIAPPVDGGPTLTSGTLELDPAVNPDAGYVLALEIENLTGPPLEFNDGCGGNGNTVCGPAAGPLDIFSASQAVVAYAAQQSLLVPGLPKSAILPATGQVLPSSTGIVVFDALSADAVVALRQNLSAQGPGSAGDVLLEISLTGTLSPNAQPQSSNTLSFPLHVCFDCGVRPLSCLQGVTAAPSGHGPCCLPQDFFDVCVACGGAGEACCALPEGVPLTCSQDSDCVTFGLGLAPPDGGAPAVGDCVIPAGAPSGSCICQGDADCQTFYGASSTCQQGTCTPGCNADTAGQPLACAVATKLEADAEDCWYPNARALTSVCAIP
jgi:hypothetical protein